jgi:hypothetical protein
MMLRVVGGDLRSFRNWSDRPPDLAQVKVGAWCVAGRQVTVVDG